MCLVVMGEAELLIELVFFVSYPLGPNHQINPGITPCPEVVGGKPPGDSCVETIADWLGT